MHCHTQEGSVDGQVPIEAYINRLKELGYDGMMVTDHDSYRAYRYYRDHLKDKIDDFVVLKGIEYDTLDAGHMLVLMPSKVKLKILEHRGLPLKLLIPIVHKYGGILGPAHPFGERFMSIYSTGLYKKDRSITEQFDFIEVYNCCEDEQTNKKAAMMAKRYRKPGLGGSDSHKMDCIGLAYTEIGEYVKTEDEMIAYIKAKKPIRSGGGRYMRTVKDRIGKWNKILVYGFFPYNKVEAVFHLRKRRNELKAMFEELIKEVTEKINE